MEYNSFLGRIQHECILRSTGSVNSVVNGMYQNLIRNECALSSPSMWPADFGPAVFKRSKAFYDFFISIKKLFLLSIEFPHRFVNNLKHNH